MTSLPTPKSARSTSTPSGAHAAPIGPSVVILVIHFGAWPEWFPFFLESCRWNPTIDWLIVCDAAPPADHPRNVRFLMSSLGAMAKRIEARLDVAANIESAYKLCDFRLAFARLFDDVIAPYAFFGWGDSDVIYGNLRRVLDPRAFECDVIAFYDQHLSGHLTLVRNVDGARNLHLVIADWAERAARKEYQHLDEPSPDLLRPAFNVWARQSFNTPLSPYAPWRDGTFTFPTEWYWREGRLTNDLDGDVEFLYLHFMHWKGGAWPRECGNAQWEKLDRIIHVDPALAGRGFRVTAGGFFPL